ncbi:uncharacterized protein TNCV_1605241 [Trichonephila clavipes]|nr:uncharacterized protein TNCV_1605241 [Trichonephila clavipes]
MVFNSGVSVSLVATNATFLTVLDRGARNSSRQTTRCTAVVSRSFEHDTSDSTFWLGSTSILERTPKGCLGAFHLSSPSTNLTRGLDGYLEYSHAAKAPYICKHPCIFWDSNPGPTAQHSASITTKPDGIHECFLTSLSAKQMHGILAMALLILNHCQVPRMISELIPPLLPHHDLPSTCRVLSGTKTRTHDALAPTVYWRQWCYGE